MTAKFCTKCGKELVAGKRFCGGCGLKAPEPVVAARQEPLPEPIPTTESAPRLCGQCGAALLPGKRFCRQCGHAVELSAAAPEVEPPGMGFPPITDCAPVALPPVEPVPQRWTEVVEEKPLPAAASPASVDAPQVEHRPQRAAEILPPLRSEQDECASEISPQTPTKQAESPVQASPPAPPPTPVEPQAFAPKKTPQQAEPAPLAVPSEPFHPVQPAERSKAKIGLAIALAAVVLVVASGAAAWYVYTHRSDASGAKPPAGSTQSAALPQAGNESPVVPAAPMQQDKPSAGSRPSSVPSAPQTPANPATNANPVPQRSILAPNTGLSGHGNPAGPTPAFRTPPPTAMSPLPVATAPGRSGARHYQGPPVAYGGVVVFDNLPRERLKFTFDSTAWRLIIKPNPDGSKKVILNSLKQGYQTSCDLGWEMIE